MDRRLVWEQTEVEPSHRGATDVVIPLSGTIDDDWREHFEQALAERQRRPGRFDERALEHPWGPASLNRSRVRVERVPEGQEAALRQFLEGCLEAAEQRYRDAHEVMRRTQEQAAQEESQGAERAVRMRERFRGQRTD